MDKRVTIQDMRDTLVAYENREQDINRSRSAWQTQQNIKDWLSMPDEKVIAFYNKFFQ